MLSPTGTTHKFQINHINGAWQIGYENVMIGYIDDVQWDGQFTQATDIRWYGEVHSPTALSQAQMGNGICGAFSGSATIENMFFVRNGQEGQAQATLLRPENAHYYDSDKLIISPSFNSFRYGGPGAVSRPQGSCP